MSKYNRHSPQDFMSLHNKTTDLDQYPDSAYNKYYKALLLTNVAYAKLASPYVDLEVDLKRRALRLTLGNSYRIWAKASGGTVQGHFINGYMFKYLPLGYYLPTEDGWYEYAPDYGDSGELTNDVGQGKLGSNEERRTE